jgi:2-polyprenyl-6-methoxyphenol hydroxylase-like FAD-dependent oxidoreductase
MALEDTVTLAECLERASTTNDIPKVLKAYQEIREPRCKLVQTWSSTQGKRVTIPDGPVQEQRDKRFGTQNAWIPHPPWDGVQIDELPELDSPYWAAWLSGHDAVAFVS